MNVPVRVVVTAGLIVLAGCGDADTPGCHCARAESFEVDAGASVCAPLTDDGGTTSFPCGNLFERSPAGTYARPAQFVVTGRSCTASESQSGCENGLYQVVWRR